MILFWVLALSLPHLLHEILHIDNLNAMELFQISEVGVTGDDEVSLGFQSTSKEHVV